MPTQCTTSCNPRCGFRIRLHLWRSPPRPLSLHQSRGKQKTSRRRNFQQGLPRTSPGLAHHGDHQPTRHHAGLCLFRNYRLGGGRLTQTLFRQTCFDYARTNTRHSQHGQPFTSRPALVTPNAGADFGKGGVSLFRGAKQGESRLVKRVCNKWFNPIYFDITLIYIET